MWPYPKGGRKTWLQRYVRLVHPSWPPKHLQPFSPEHCRRSKGAFDLATLRNIKGNLAIVGRLPLIFHTTMFLTVRRSSPRISVGVVLLL